jgi:hypothetical protein
VVQATAYPRRVVLGMELSLRLSLQPHVSGRSRLPLSSSKLIVTPMLLSGGNVTLKSTNPFEAPIINPNFLSTETDIVSS